MIDTISILGRKNVPLPKEHEKQYYLDKTVLVTGAGGSIGGVLVRMLARRKCRRVILFDISENSTYELYLELCEEYGDTDFFVEIGSVRDFARMDEVFKRYKPEIVFHAAAHKHVSLMENNPLEAIKNNCIGTLNCAKACEKNGCSKFVLISTDKAVKPCGVMGASKRICEMLVLQRNEKVTDYCAVRFGNVFGSSASVVPIFERQIAKGGPVTVTDKRMTRYFISLEDAGHLLLCAGAMAKHGELFVLDMGQPYKIWDIAEKMIASHGKKPGVDIEIVETGARPGEKIFEEYLLCDSERYEKTANDMIYIEKGGVGAAASCEEIEKYLTKLLSDKRAESTPDIVKKLFSDIIPDYNA